ncbi:MAG: methyltransferase domain-containing protein [Anaerolineae bacterium]
MATRYGCQVTGLDLTEEYCRVAQMLADRIGLGELVKYRHGNALDMPFDEVNFDVCLDSTRGNEYSLIESGYMVKCGGS